MYNPNKQARGAGGRFGGKAKAVAEATGTFGKPPLVLATTPMDADDVRRLTEAGPGTIAAYGRDYQPPLVVPRPAPVPSVGRAMPSIAERERLTGDYAAARDQLGIPSNDHRPYVAYPGQRPKPLTNDTSSGVTLPVAFGLAVIALIVLAVVALGMGVATVPFNG